MPTQDVIWTVLPNGFRREPDHHAARLSIFIAPRLMLDGSAATATEGTLGTFPIFLDWPGHLRSRNFVLQTGDGRDVAARIVTDPGPDSALWKALFPADTLVRSHSPDELPGHYVSYPASEIKGSLSRGYAELMDRSHYRPSDDTALAAAFPHLQKAIQRRAPPSPAMEARVARYAEATGPELEQLRHDLLSDFLSLGSQSHISDRLSKANLLASRQALMLGGRAAVPVMPTTGDPSSPFAQLAAFHQMPRLAMASTVSPASANPRFDFHQILSALGEYPSVLRRLGLIIDLEIDPSALPPSKPGNPATLAVKFRDSGPAQATPVTYFLFDTQPAANDLLPFEHFVACPRSCGPAPGAALPPSPDKVEIIGGLLNCAMARPDSPNTFQFDLLQVDIDGAALKVMNAIRSATREQASPAQPIDAPAPGGAATLRTSGISVVRSGNAEDILGNASASSDHNDGLNSGSGPKFFAEDLVRGYRIDARAFPSDYQVGSPAPPSARWLSLHKRAGTFTIRGGEPAAIADEGFTQPALVEHGETSGPGSGTVSIHESLSIWRGWSSSASPPFAPTDDVLRPSAGTPPPTPVLPEIDVAFRPEDGSLPRLRFGQYYQLRIRTADLAGNGLRLNEADDLLSALTLHDRRLPILFEKAEDFFRYCRFEAIDAPVLVPRAELGEGEAPDMLVIRSEGAPRPKDAPRTTTTGFNPETERHVVPPKTALVMAEAHGMLDGAFGPGGDPAAFYNFCLKESGSLNDAFLVNLSTGNRDPLSDVTTVDPVTGAPVVIPHGVKFVHVGDPGSKQGYSIHYEEQLKLPYLPDPFARGAALFGLPGVGVIEGSGQLVGDELRFLGPDGELLPEDARKELGFVTKIHFGERPQWHDRLSFRMKLKAVDDGVAPPKPEWDAASRVLTVCLPPGERQDIWVSSYPGEDSTLIMGVAKWWLTNKLGPGASLPSDRRHFINTAPHGALSMISPARKVTLMHATLRPVRPPRSNPHTPFTAFKLAKESPPLDSPTFAYIGGNISIHSKSTSKLDLVATWSERGAGAGGQDYRSVSTHVFEIPIHIDRPALPTTGSQVSIHEQNGDDLTFIAPASLTQASTKRYLARHEFGDTKYRKVTYRLLATSRFAEQFPSAATGVEGATSCFTEITQDVLSSAPPVAPEISYIVPAQQWLPVVDDPGITDSTRRGGALRVFLGTTWYSSGDGEQLAIVGDPEWGFDPIHHAGSEGAGPIPDPKPIRIDGMQIYPFDASYDKSTGLWYADIVFRNGAYFPFVRLELARYQPQSCPGRHLSASVHAGFHQLLPDRVVSLTYAGGGSRIGLTVTGPRPSGPTARIKYAIVVSLEEREAARKDWDPDLGWQPAAAEQQPVADPPGPDQLWSGHIVLTRPGDERDRRIVIREFELFPKNDCDSGQEWPGDVAPALAGFSPRLVYMDTIPLKPLR